jgi:lipopolysaccharide export system permease protein
MGGGAVAQGTPAGAAMIRLLDRYVLRSWIKLFIVTAIGFPIVAVVTEMIQELHDLLAKGLSVKQIAVSYIFGIPAWASLVMPAAVLFATIFTVGNMARHSELTAAKAGGASFRRLVLPLFLAALAASGLAILVGELAVTSSARQAQLQKDPSSINAGGRYNFVYRADEGWTYTIRSLDVASRTLRDLVFERAGTGDDYPTLVVRADSATWNDLTEAWTLWNGQSRVLGSGDHLSTFDFSRMQLAAFSQAPEQLLLQDKAPKAMRYGELGRYIDAMRRAGNATGDLQVQRAQRIAIPMACLVIALFGAPLAMAAPRSGTAFGIGVSLAATVIYILLAQIATAMGDSNMMSPAMLAWLPDLLFLLAAMVLLDRVRS